MRLRVAESTWLDGRLVHPLDSVTVVANLLDNAIRAAKDGERRPAWVEVALLSDDTDLLVHVTDSGPGVAPEIADSLFDHGFTTRRARRHRPRHRPGAGPAHRPGAPGRRAAAVPARGPHGAVFEARMVDVLAHQVLPERTAT